MNKHYDVNINLEHGTILNKMINNAISTALYEITKRVTHSTTEAEMKIKLVLKLTRKQLTDYKHKIEKIKSKMNNINESVNFDDMIAEEAVELNLDDSFNLENEIFDI